MSNTRYAEPGGPLRQERWASSEAYKGGLLANMVAKRCSVLERPEDRELIWFLQGLSWTKGGLAQVAQAVVNGYPGALGTASMREFGCDPGQVYTAHQVRKIRREIPDSKDLFLLRGEFSGVEQCVIESQKMADWEMFVDTKEEADQARAASAARPDLYPASAFSQYCLREASGLAEYLEELCLKPELDLQNPKTNPWYCAGLVGALRSYMADWARRGWETTVVTKLGAELLDAFHRTNSRLSHECMGREGTGKTFFAQRYCELHPGRARYLEVPFGSDTTNLLRAIAEALGLSKSNNLKAQDLSNRVMEVAGAGNLVLCMDEAHRLWNSTTRNYGMPSRIELVISLQSGGVPIVLISTLQSLKAQKEVESRTNWNTAQWRRRFQFRSLAERLGKEDLYKIARAVLPEMDGKIWNAVAVYASKSVEHAGAVNVIRENAEYLANQEGRRQVAAEDVIAAFGEKLDLDTTMLKALQSAEAAVKGRRRAMAAPVAPEPGEVVADNAPAHREPILRPMVADGRAGLPGLIQDRIAPATELVA